MSCSELVKIRSYGGGNYFIEEIGKNSQGWIVWDKKHPETIKYADCELAWTSFNVATRIYRYKWNGMMQENMKDKEVKINPCQKPVALYAWILNNYAKSGDKILDTHVGSASSLIACHKLRFEYVGFEIDPTYYKASKERLDRAKAQVSMFDM